MSVSVTFQLNSTPTRVKAIEAILGPDHCFPITNRLASQPKGICPEHFQKRCITGDNSRYSRMFVLVWISLLHIIITIMFKKQTHKTQNQWNQYKCLFAQKHSLVFFWRNIARQNHYEQMKKLVGITCVSAIDLDHSFVTSWRYFTTLSSYEPKHKIKKKKEPF